MNDVPIVFYERICREFSDKSMSACRNLSGRFAAVGADVIDKTARHCVAMRNGQFHDGEYYSYFKGLQGNFVKFKKASRMHHFYTAVTVSADSGDYSTDPAALEELSAATKGKRVFLCLKTAKLSKELEKLLDSIQFCSFLNVTADIPRIPQSLIQKKTLNEVKFMVGSKISDEAINQLVELLKQEQFYEAVFHVRPEPSLTKLLAAWREDASEMAGKVVVCKEKVTLDRELGFTKCTKEELRSFGLYYPQFKSRLIEAPPFNLWSSFSYFKRAQSNVLILRSAEGGAAIYCLINPKSYYKTLFVLV